MSNEIAMLYNDMFSYNRVKDDICRNCNDLNCRIGDRMEEVEEGRLFYAMINQ